MGIARTKGVIDITLKNQTFPEPAAPPRKSGTLPLYAAAAAAFGDAAPNYPSIVRLWQGFVFMFGCMFWEASRDIRGKAALLKYNWIEKTITATAITLGYCTGDIPARLMFLIILANWLWIPFILWGDLAVRKALRSAP